MILTILMLGGCIKAGYFLSSISHPIKPLPFQYSDGYEGIYYSYISGDNDKSDTLLFYIGGSGCPSYKYYLQSYLKDLNPGIKVYALQKRGVASSSTGMFGCSKEFVKYDYFQQWVSDQQQFVDFVLKSQNTKQKNIVVFGISEGGSVAAFLASKIPQITHLAIIGSGGMPQIEELKILSEKNKWKWKLDEEIEKIRRHSESIEKKMAGHSYKYWSSIMDVNPMKFYLGLDIPVLVAHGEDDTSVPIESAYHIKKVAHDAGKNNIQIIVYKDSDHTLIDNKGFDHKPEFIRKINRYIQ